MMTLVWLAVGLVCLVMGAESLVRGAARLATMMGISPLVVGLTIVAFGTSAPELAVSISLASRGRRGSPWVTWSAAISLTCCLFSVSRP